MTMTEALHKKFLDALSEWQHIPEGKRPTQWHFWHYGHWYTIRIIDGAANVWRVSENSNADQWIGSEEVKAMTEQEKINARQRLIVYIRANTKRYVERMGADGTDWDFVEDIRKVLNTYDSDLTEIPVNHKSSS